MLTKLGIILLLILGLALIAPRFILRQHMTYLRQSQWEIQSIDTMKYSRDLAREKLTDEAFRETINEQVKAIAQTGATHVAIGTPYDPEFLPYLKAWVAAARNNHLHVWFRGNFSGWEGWFEYSKINRATHTQKVIDFITHNPNLFQDGDLFASCPECENGGPGDPRQTGDIRGHRKFLIEEYEATSRAFKKINKNVASNYNGMNYDVASVIMDTETTEKLGGIVVIDHYVKTPHETVLDIRKLAKNTGGRIMLGEVGVPIPDIHGTMTEDEQAAWIKELIQKLSQEENVVGINYWTAVGASSEIWDSHMTPHKAVKVIHNAFKFIDPATSK